MFIVYTIFVLLLYLKLTVTKYKVANHLKSLIIPANLKTKQTSFDFIDISICQLQVQKVILPNRVSNPGLSDQEYSTLITLLP